MIGVNKAVMRVFKAVKDIQILTHSKTLLESYSS